MTVTSVETSPDLRTAKVYVSVLGDEEEREATLEGLRSSHGVLQSKIAAETRMKRTPTLTFHYDDTIEQGMRISRAARGARTRSERAAADVADLRLERVAAELRDRDRFLLTAHEGPDGDALGSLLGHAPPAHPARQGLGDVHGGEGVPAADRVPLPAAGGGLPRAAGRHGRPHRRLPRLRQHRPDAGRLPHRRAATTSSTSTTTTTTPASATSTWSTSAPPAPPRSSTTWRCCSAARITPEIASALYVGLITDTGKFMYENTNARTHRIAADLIEAGVDVDDTYRRLYEHVPIEKLRLVSRALDGIQRHCDERLVLTYITAADYEATGAGEEMTEGIIDHLRSIEGAKVAAVIRDLGDRGRAARKVSLRSSDGDVDVSAIARKNGRRRPQARRRLLDRPRARASWSSSSATRSAPSSAR